MSSIESPPSSLRWRCRRGMRELDVLLGRWLDQAWSEASSDLREAFAALLQREDNEIWDWLMGRVEPDSEFEALIDDIRSLSERARS